MSIKYLKIKVVSLAAEAQLIHGEERRTVRQLANMRKHPRAQEWAADISRSESDRQGLWRHRVVDVAREARAAQLAYGFLRGKKYEVIETPGSTSPNWDRVRALVAKYGDRIGNNYLMSQFEDWRRAANETNVRGHNERVKRAHDRALEKMAAISA